MYWWPGHSPKPYKKNQNKRENLKSHEHAEFSRLARCMISLKSTLIGCKITGFENSYACIIPTQFLWGQGSSVLTNKHTNSCSPPKSHLVHINQMEGNETWESISQCLPKRRGRWRLLKTAPPISLSYRIGRKEDKPIVVWLSITIAQLPVQSLQILCHPHICRAVYFPVA